MNWNPNLVGVGLDQRFGPYHKGTFVLALYAMHLGSGNTLLCQTIRVDTLKRYIHHVSSWLALFGEYPRDFRYDNPGDSRFSKLLQAVYDELQRWEKVPDRREPFTPYMLAILRGRVTKLGDATFSLEAALLDWFTIGLFTGHRLSEWAQPSSRSDPSSPQLNGLNETAAFCLNDVAAETRQHQRISGAEILHFPRGDIVKMWLTWRTQKNGSNGENKMWTRNPDNLAHCFVDKMYNILDRFVKSRGASDTTTPLSLYIHHGHCRLITDTDIEDVMRSVAIEAHHLHPKKDAAHIKLWSSHSLRVGACVLLHSQGFTGEQIKFMLRWKSNAFMTYLRNTTIISDRVNIAFNEASSMPHF